MPNIAFIIAPPILRSTPAFVVGIPVALVNSRFTFVTPSALFKEKYQSRIDEIDNLRKDILSILNSVLNMENTEQDIKDKVFDFSLGNPSVEPPKEVNETIKDLCDKESAILLHGYTSAQGDINTRKVIAKNIKKRSKIIKIACFKVYYYEILSF